MLLCIWHDHLIICDLYLFLSPSLTMTQIRHYRSQRRSDNTSLWNEGTAWYHSTSLFTHSGSIHYKQDPVVSVSPHSPFLTYTCSKLLGYRASLSSHNAYITNRVTGNKRPVTRACLPPSVEHAVLSITIQHYTLPFHLRHTVGSLFHPGPRWAFKSQMSEAGLQPDT